MVQRDAPETDEFAEQGDGRTRDPSHGQGGSQPGPVG